MKSWKTRLLMVLTMLAVVLAVSVPAVADDVEIECEADGGYCKEELTWVSEYEEVDPELQEDDASDPTAVELDECYPFCGLEWWPW